MKKSFYSIAILPVLGFILTMGSPSNLLHVDGTNGSDSNSGLSRDQALKTVQAAIDKVQTGDEVRIYEGVYFENVTLQWKSGTEDNPIIFRADESAKNRVVITSANPDIRKGMKTWTLVNASLGLYSVPFYGSNPMRVVYGGVDLYPYSSLNGLNSFTIPYYGDKPGPRHGWFLDDWANKLYVRLHASGRYGSTNPNNQTMAIGPSHSGANFTIKNGNQPVHVVLDGITFETPGRDGVSLEASAVTIQNCWFVGCPYGVRGSNYGEAQDPGAGLFDTASDIIIQSCEFTEESSYNDAMDLLELRKDAGQTGEITDIWHRKTSGNYGLPAGGINYETGLASRIGRGWIIRNNYIHDIFEGLANDGMNESVDTLIYGNVFSRICDNGVETENHARNASIYRNVFKDNFMPFSYQPLKGLPWPGPIYFYQNIIANTEGVEQGFWDVAHTRRAAFKIGISGQNNATPPLVVPPPGALFYHNTVFFPGGNLIELMGYKTIPLENAVFENNLFLNDDFSRTLDMDGVFEFKTNLVYFTGIDADVAAAGGGTILANRDAFGWTDEDNGDFSLEPGSPAIGAGGSYTNFSDLGAIQQGDTWYPLSVGPNASVSDYNAY